MARLNWLAQSILIAAATFLIAQSPSPQQSPNGTNNYYYSGNWYYGRPSPAETKGGKKTDLGNNRSDHDKRASQNAAVSANRLNATKSDQTQTARESDIAAPIAPPINVHVHIDNHDAVIAWATWVLAFVGVVQLFLLYYTYQANKRNAEASKEYASLAALSLKSNRPILLAKEAVLRFDTVELCDDCYSIGLIDVTLINYGAGPALVLNVTATCSLLELTVDQSSLDHKDHDLRICRRIEFKQGLIVNNAPFKITMNGDIEIERSRFDAFVIKEYKTLSAEERAVFRLCEETIDSFMESRPSEVTEGLVVYGNLTYTDVFGKDNYSTDFCLNLFLTEIGRDEADGLVRVASESSLGPKHHNNHT